MAKLVQEEWHGDRIKKKSMRAAARALIGLGEAIAVDGARNAHVISGDLRDSVHAAKAGTGGHGGVGLAELIVGVRAVIEVGSWLDYACVEEVGRGHAFMAPAYQANIGKANVLFLKAFREEGL